jgi:hypothetical protein
MLRDEQYVLLVVDSKALDSAATVSRAWGFHHAFREAWQAGRLQEFGVKEVGEFRLVGHDMVVFELLPSYSQTYK